MDTGANAYALINQNLIRSLTKVLRMPVHKLKKPIPLRGFDGQPSEAIQQVIELNLELDKHEQPRQYLLVAELGSHELILGRKWLAKHDILPDCRRNCLHWPEDHKSDQWDSNRRDRLFSEGCQQRNEPTSVPVQVLKNASTTPRPGTKGRRPGPSLGDFQTRKAEYQWRKEELELDTINTISQYNNSICLIGAAAFQTSVKETGSYSGSVTIDEIDHALEKVKRKPPLSCIIVLKRLKKTQLAGCYALAKEVMYSLDEDEQDTLGNTTISDTVEIEELKATLLPWLYKLVDAFSKRAADTLPQSRPFDHKLRFDGPEPSMTTAHLYKMSTPELEKMREYLVENLKKGFIKPSDSSYSSPVLFVKKKDRSLRFCINYR